MTPQIAHADFDAARLELLRRRVMVMAMIVAILLGALSTVAEITMVRTNRPDRVTAVAPAIAGAMLIVGSLRLRTRRNRMSLSELVRRTGAVVVVAVVIQVPASKIIAGSLSEGLRHLGLPRAQIGALVPLFLSMLLIHLTASIVLPWSLWESARPVIAIVCFALLATPFAPDPWPTRIGGLLGLVLMGTPGMLVSWWRFSRFRERVTMRFLSTRIAEMQRELETARRIHEKFFPAKIGDGPVLFDYRYEPMQEIGGDFVDVVRGSNGSGNVILVDITGHGIAAALAVNRLHGEVKRAVAMKERRGPAQVISALNEYMNLTLADEGVFGTAFAATIDPVSRQITWCSAGHPPAFLCRANGAIELLDSTAIMLGPIPAEQFDSSPRTRDFNEGDVLIAYTDGGIECRDAHDSQLGIEGLQRIVHAQFGKPTPQMLDAIMSGIANFRSCPAEDDTLILAVQFSPATSSNEKDRT